MCKDIEYLDSVVAKHGHRVFAMYNAKVSDTNVYIGRGRGSIMGNPFATNDSKTLQDRIDNCIAYRNHMFQVVRTNSDPQLIQAIKDLKGKNVICFCSNGTDSVSKGARYCHGHIILNICEYLNKD